MPMAGLELPLLLTSMPQIMAGDRPGAVGGRRKQIGHHEPRLDALRERIATGPMQTLITGGAGFIGSHLADDLVRRGHRVRALDNLSPQVHGPDAGRPPYLHPDVELQQGDVRDAQAVRRALAGVEAVVHFAAAVGVGQSMYEIDHYTSTNNLGTLRGEAARRRVLAEHTYAPRVRQLEALLGEKVVA
ncbi:hypothetical protein BH23PLA1_BH23PLA1_29710 [soil metagenome]